MSLPSYLLPELPKRWKWSSLEALIDREAPIIYGILQPGPNLQEGVPYVRPSEMSGGGIDMASIRRTTPAIAKRYRRASLKTNDLLISIVGTIGRIARVPAELEGGNITQSSARLRPDLAQVDTAYLQQVLGAGVLTRQYDFFRLGTGVPRLNIDHVRSLQIPVPPLSEQKRIAAILDKADEVRRKRAETIRLTEELLRSAFLEMFGDPVTNPKEQVVPLGDLVEVKGGKRLPKGADYADGPTAHPYIRVTDIATGRVNQPALRYLTPTVQAKIRRYTISSDDVMISIAGSIGLIATIPPELDGANLTENAAKLVIKDKSSLDKQYLVSYLRIAAQGEIAKRTKATSQPKLALYRIEEIPILLPSLARQDKFSHIHKKLESAYHRLETLQGPTEALTSSLTQRAFRGEL